MIESTKKIMSGGAIASQPQAPRSAKRSARQAEFARQRTKRVIDIVGALVFFAMFGGIFLAVWLGVLLTTGRPAIYRHQRIGYRGKPFHCLKFRSMTPDSDAVLEQFLADNEAAREEWRLTFKLRNDPRVTRFGCLLRRTSLDELPQFWNVLRGDMSLVGPRPVVRKELDCFYGADAAKMYESVKPGLTGPWQVGGRSDTTYKERVAFDCDYVRNCSTWGDIKLIARTASSVLTGRGSY